MKYIETRILSAKNLRSLCIQNNWYTRGNNEEYKALFDRLYDDYGCKENMTTDKLVEIAEDIWEHSNITDYSITNILYALGKACISIFDEDAAQ